VRKQQLEDLFGSYESRGVQGVRSWAAMHLAASGPSRYATTSWIANKAPEFCDLDIYGPPDTGNREVDRILWLNGILPVLREEDFADWSTWGVIDAAVNTAIEHYNLDEPEAWALLYYLAESSKGDGYRVPHRLPDILDRRNAVTDEVIAGGLALLARWRTAASAKFSSPAEPGPAAPTTTPRPPWYVEELDGPRAEGAA
jgi:hypothetical protein